MRPVVDGAARLLLIGYWAAGSGLARVLERLAREHARQAEVRILGLVPAGRQGARVPDGVNVSEVPQHERQFRIAPALLRRQIEEFRPRDVVVMGPPFLVALVVEALQPYRATVRVVLHLTLEGELVSPIPLHLLDLVDTCALYTENARARLAELAEQNGRRPSAALAVLGHGVDTELFSPVNRSRADVRRELFPDRPFLHDAFLVLNSNRNYRRKRLDLTIAGFAEFGRDRPDAYLYLHACGLGARRRAELERTIGEAGAAGKVLLNVLNPDGAPLPDPTMNLLYNACDVGVTTSMGEGWGLGTFEHAATGAAQVVPGHTSFQENWNGAAALLPPTRRVHGLYEYSDMFEVSALDVARELGRLYDDRELLRRMSRAAYDRATEQRFGWRDVGRRFRAILDAQPAVAPVMRESPPR